MTTDQRRATSMDEFVELQSGMAQEGMIDAIRNFRPTPTDVIISPFGKCGTTWLQQMVHTLRTGGDTDYDDISRVVPWIETAPLLGVDLDAPQKAPPRAFKSHLAWDQIPKGAKYLVSIRDPKDALVSMFHFMNGWFIEPGSVSIDEFALGPMTQRGQKRDYWHHLASWWRVRDQDNVLLLTYEGMVRNPQDTVRQIADFIGIFADAQLLQITMEHTSLDYMLTNKHQFDDRLMREMSESRLGLPGGSDSAKVRAGKIGARGELSPATGARLDDIWTQTIGEELGFASYDELASALAD